MKLNVSPISVIFLAAQFMQIIVSSASDMALLMSSDDQPNQLYSIEGSVILTMVRTARMYKLKLNLSRHLTLNICPTCWRSIHWSAVSFSKTKWKSSDVRRTFIEFFCQKYDHSHVPSSSVLPKKGEGTYFINAGMNQFKPIFLGKVEKGSEMSHYKRVVNSQKCIRVGGKHNDLDTVGNDLHHHTFFEMLGSWSFGDYFKKESCSMALELLTNVYGLQVDRLYFTYFGGDENLGLLADEECKAAWLDVGVPEHHILACSKKDNFWDMGTMGPCGPCTEIHYDHVGGRDARNLVNKGSPDVTEIWNLVFMQFNRQADQSLVELPNVHVDTGAGLERLTAVLQGHQSNYDTDLFRPLFNRIQKETGAPEYRGQTGRDDDHKIDTAYRITADHARMMSVAIADGLLPGSRNLEHMLRRIMHRCIREARFGLKSKPHMIATLIDVVSDSLGEAFPEISKSKDKIKDIITVEEDKYMDSLEKGRKVMEKLLNKLGKVKQLTGEYVWDLYQGKYGPPLSIDTILDVAAEHGVAVDLEIFDERLHEMKSESLENRRKLREKFNTVLLDGPAMLYLQENGIATTEDSFKYEFRATEENTYDFYGCDVKNSKLVAILHEGQFADYIWKGEQCGILLEKTGFYSEAGGQVSDTGQLIGPTGVFQVESVQSYQGYVLHSGHVLEGSLKTEDMINTVIDKEHRLNCMRNHTATHLVNAALRQVVGKDTRQCGSLVESNKLVFDYTTLSKLTDSQLLEIESKVKNIITASLPVYRQSLPLSEALNYPSVISLVDESYPSNVYVVTIGDKVDGNTLVSAELCGGTHVENTSHIKDFCIVKSSGVQLGKRRIVAATASQAEKAVQNGDVVDEMLKELEMLVKSQESAKVLFQKEKELHEILSTVILPKIISDPLEKKLNVLGVRIGEIRNKYFVECIKEEIFSNPESHNSFIIQEMAFSSYKEILKGVTQMVKTAKSIEFTHPFSVYSVGEKATTFVICFPEGPHHPVVNVASVSDHVSSLFRSNIKQILKVKRKGEEKYIVIRYNGSPERLVFCLKDLFGQVYKEIKR